MNLSRKCPICNSNQGKEMKKFCFSLAEGNPLPKEYIVVSCDKCGFVYANMEASQEQYNDYYANFNMYSEDEDLKDNGIVPNRYRSLKNILDNYVDKDASIVDIGCGSGGSLRYLKDNGYKNLLGCDPSSESINKLKASGIQGIVMNIFGDDLSENSDMDGFDVVVSLAVIEHIYDVNGYVNKLLKLLKTDKSFLVMYAPAIEGFDENMKPIANYVNHEHINYFSVNSLDNLLTMHGMERVNNEPYIYEYNEKYIMAVYKKGVTDNSIIKDTVSWGKMNTLIWENEKNDKKILDILNREKSVVIWGCGSYLMRLLSDYPQLAEKIEFIVDNNTTKQGTFINHKEVKNPNCLKTDCGDSIIAIASMRNIEEIMEQISGMKIKNDVVVL